MNKMIQVSLAAVLAAGALAASTAARADVLGYTFNSSGFSATGTTNNGGKNGGANSYDLGYTFNVTSPVTVDGLAAYNFGGTSIGTSGTLHVAPSIPVAVYSTTDTTTPLISGTVTATTPTYNLDGSAYTGTSNGESGSGFSTVTLATPVVLQDGTYMIAAGMNNNAYYAQSVAVNAAPGLGTTFATRAYNAPGSGVDETTAPYPTTDNNAASGIPNDWFGGNLVLAPSVPEPASLVLLAAGGLVLLRRRRRLA